LNCCPMVDSNPRADSPRSQESIRLV
jgi:hypothetical protein